MKSYDFRIFDRSEAGQDRYLPAIPELSDGFDASLDVRVKGMTPVTAWTENVQPGIYAVHIAIVALRNIEKLYLFTGRKQLREILSLKKGECFMRTYYQSVAEIIPRYHNEEHPVEHLFFTVCTDNPKAVYLDLHTSYAVPAPEAMRIFLCGDSTVTEHAGGIPYHPGACYAGWGQALPAFLTGAVAVENQAHCGLTTEAFREEGHFDIVKRNIRSGDLCLFQFGHNDQKLPHLLPHREYLPNLCRFLQEIREKGAHGVLVSPLGRNIWNADGTYLDLLKEYAEAIEEAAQLTGTPWINLHGFSTDFIRQHGMEAAKGYFYPGDYTHCNEYGAYTFAGYVAGELGRIFPDALPCVQSKKNFVPPKGLWDMMETGQSHASVKSQREQFDSMEKSTSALLNIIAEAKRKGECEA